MGLSFCCICCIADQTANYLENSLIIFLSISLLSFILCFAFLPWEYISKGGKAFLILDFILLLYSLATVIYFKILRRQNSINTSKNYLANILSKIMFGVISIGFIFIIISEAIISTNFVGIIIKSTNFLVEIFGMSIIEVMWILSFCYWIVEYKLISLKLEGKYLQYTKALHTTQQPVQIVNSNGLVTLGNDESGKSIYTQPAIIVQPIGMQQPIYPENINNQNAQPNIRNNKLGFNNNAGNNFGSAAELDKKNDIPNPLDQDVAPR